MVRKTISDLIFDKFSESIEKDKLFENISKDLITLIGQKKCSKTKIEHLLKQGENEDSGTRN